LDNSTLEIEWIAISDLRANPANPRRNEAAVPHVAASLARFGWRQPIVAKPCGEVIAGHTRLLAANGLGMTEVPVVRFTGPDIEATAYAIADNRTAEFAEWDDEALAGLLSDLRAEDALDGVGYSASDIDDLLAQLAEHEGPADVQDAAPEAPPQTPITQKGDLWLLGEHRLLCGDASVTSDVQRVTGGEKVSLVWTDPPYGVSYVGKTKDALEIENDSLDEVSLERLLSSAFQAAMDACRPGAVWYVAAPSGPAFLPFAKQLKELGIWRQTLAWVKDMFVLGHSDFHYRHEALFYGWIPGADHRSPPTRSQDTVLEFDRPKASPDHPTSKPVELVAYCLLQSSLTGDLVLDPFTGSGTTILAAESTGRNAAGLELDPRYCDVIVKRWEASTGRDAKLDEDGRSFREVASARRGQ